MAKKPEVNQPRQYVCQTKCFFRNTLWEVGATLSPSSPDEKIPKHFVPAEEQVAPEVKKVEEPKTLSELAKQNAKTSDDILS